MAGAGYKLFNTGDVLTAAQVNTYLQEQVVMVFANATARTTALSGVLAEGMVSYLKDTDAVEKYNGTAWVSLAGSASPLTTKGDLYTYSTTDARLGVGNNGESLVADSSATTGLSWQGNFAAGKNKIINGDFRINQRSFTSTTTSATFGQDRWFLQYGGGTTTYSNESFTAGAAPVAGYEGTSFARLVSTSQSSNSNYVALIQKIEDVRTFANQTVTISFWAKASTGTPNVGVNFVQTFGSGGSADVVVTGSVIAITSSWARYSATIAVPSISGKTIGTGSNLQFNFYTSVGTTISGAGHPAVGLQNVTVDVWGVQIENGLVATAFQTATGTLAGELGACQRYYQRFGGNPNNVLYNGANYSTTQFYGVLPFITEMRTAPTVSVTGAGDITIYVTNTSFIPSAFAAGEITTKATRILNTCSGLTQGHGGWAQLVGSSGKYIEASSEL